jgi:putative hydrolase of the HAD superfamily
VFNLTSQESKLARSGLGDLFAGVEILSDKTAATYGSLLRRRGIEPAEFVMVGNSLRSDIAPVVELGARAVHIPYPVTWNHEHLPDDALPTTGWHRLGGIGELRALLESIDQDPA